MVSEKDNAEEGESLDIRKTFVKKLLLTDVFFVQNASNIEKHLGSKSESDKADL